MALRARRTNVVKGAYYNEFDPKAAAWIRELIKAKLIADGDVDERSITDVKPEEIKKYAQCHFFAGIGGWSFALRLAGWPDDEPVDTGSCPCQPLSCAGLQAGHADKRHLWPAFFNVIAERRTATVLGEQVASADGREWLAGIRADLEGMGYACGASDLCSAGVGSPNIRQRLYWVAHSDSNRRGKGSGKEQREDSARSEHGDNHQRCGEPVGLADSTGARLEGHAGHGDEGDKPGRERADKARSTPEASAPCGMGDAARGGCRVGGDAPFAGNSGHALGSIWTRSRLINCRDTKLRRVPLEPGLLPLAARIPGRVALLRGAGNAINPVVAARFIQAVRQIIS